MENELFDFMMSNSSFLFNLIVFSILRRIFLSFHSFLRAGIFCRENLSLLSFYKSNIRLYNELILCVLYWNNDLPDKKKVIIPYAFIKRSFNNMRK